MKELGLFIISLDFELLWGVKDLPIAESYKENVEGARCAIPQILALFEEYNIHATWATLGIMLNSSKEDIINSIPRNIPKYLNMNCSAYAHLDEVGDSEDSDKVHFAGELVKRIMDCSNQEIGSHSYSHYYCLEAGADIESFSIDLQRAIQIIEEKYHIPVTSFVFPRNQYSQEYLEVLRNNHIKCYRGNPQNGFDETKKGMRSMVQRVIRLLDSYIPLNGSNTYKLNKVKEKMIEIPASSFFRPYSGIKILEIMKIHRIKRQMEYAAKNSEVFHLWWHPHNFGKNSEEMVEELKEVLKYYSFLNNAYGMQSLNMKEVANMYLDN